jgi:hypothetical protein
MSDGVTQLPCLSVPTQREKSMPMLLLHTAKLVNARDFAALLQRCTVAWFMLSDGRLFSTMLVLFRKRKTNDDGC